MLESSPYCSANVGSDHELRFLLLRHADTALVEDDGDSRGRYDPLGHRRISP
jgi:hypothetical protein